MIAYYFQYNPRILWWEYIFTHREIRKKKKRYSTRKSIEKIINNNNSLLMKHDNVTSIFSYEDWKTTYSKK